MRFKLITYLCLLGILGCCQISSASSSGTFAYVGDEFDASCGFTSIQAAIDDPNQYSKILVAAGLSTNRIAYNENLTINRDMEFFGGYETCSDAISGILYIDSPMVYLYGNNTGPTININNVNNFHLYRFEISGGLGNSGGGIESNNSDIRILNSLVHSNSTNSLGGGISFKNTSPSSSNVLTLINTKVINNSALLGGGGVYCKNGKTLADENSGVSLNQTTHNSSDGGGLYLDNCNLDFYGGTKSQPNPIDISTYRGISHNSTARHGGGVYALYSNVVLLGSNYNLGSGLFYGYAGNPVNINNNTADSDQDNNGSGGAVYIKGSLFNFPTLHIHRGKINYNKARIGGAFYIGENASLNMQRNSSYETHPEDCWSNNCSVLTHNTSTFQGGAVFAENGTSIVINQTHITDNRSNNGSVLYVDSTGSSNNIVLDQNFIYHNGRNGTGGFDDNTIIELYNNSEITSSNNLNAKLMHNTIVDNHATQAVLTINGVNTFLGVFSSILHDPTSASIGNLFGAFNTAEFDCVNVNETTSIDVSYSTLSRMNADNPGFVVRNYDYHIKAASATEDYCDNSNIGSISSDRDIDNTVRAVDNTSFQDFYGPYDLGADENINSTGVDIDVIFIDSFDW